MTNPTRTHWLAGTPESACRKANAFCSSVNRFRFIPGLLANANQSLTNSHSRWTRKQGGDQQEINVFRQTSLTLGPRQARG